MTSLRPSSSVAHCRSTTTAAAAAVAPAMGAAATAVLVVLRLLLCVSTGFLSGALAQQTSSSADVYCGSLTQDARVVSTADHALTLGADLTACPGLEFNVYWRGAIGLSQPLQLTNATILRIIGESKEESVASGGGEVSLFVASGQSVLYLESVGLTGGYGVDGGAVAAVGGSSVTLVDCDVYGNRAASKGGEWGQNCAEFLHAQGPRGAEIEICQQVVSPYPGPLPLGLWYIYGERYSSPPMEMSRVSMAAVVGTINNERRTMPAILAIQSVYSRSDQ